jgi:hypothetical protein
LDKSNNDIIEYTNTVLSNGFIIGNKIAPEFATRIDKNSRTIIDHFITDLIKNKYHMLILDTDLSDHQQIIVSVNVSPVKDDTVTKKIILKYEEVDRDPFWDRIHTFSCFDELVNNLSLLIKRHTTEIIIKNENKKMNG